MGGEHAEQKPWDDKLDMVIAKIRDSKCSVCDEKASGTGEGVMYCQLHFWAAFDVYEHKRNDLTDDSTATHF